MTSLFTYIIIILSLIHICDMGIKVLPPDINCGQGEFTAEGDHVRYGMYAIKSVSYTHLAMTMLNDLDESVAVSHSSIQEIADSTESTAEAVSYTHLDVYKRQGYLCVYSKKPGSCI